MSSEDRHPFNNDILDSEADRDRLKAKYRAMVPVLDDPEFRALFNSYDKPANDAKTFSSRAGFGAVCCGAIALWLTAFHQLSAANHAADGHGDVGALGIAAGFLGILSFAIGFCGLLYAGPKRRWLERRLMTEQLRQFHFQKFIWRLPEVAKLLSGAMDATSFAQLSKSWLEQFRTHHEGRLTEELDLLTQDEHSDHRDVAEPQPFWWHHPQTQLPDLDAVPSDKLQQFFEAYGELRIGHQLSYAGQKLPKNRLSLKSPRGQAAVFSTISIAAILALFVIHLGELLLQLWGHTLMISPSALHFITLVIAVAALAIRALEEGLQPEREIERYATYRSRIRDIEVRYKTASTPAQKIEIMKEMEHLAFEEMRNFVKTYKRASFVM